jgi:hypothetical protein
MTGPANFFSNDWKPVREPVLRDGDMIELGKAELDLPVKTRELVDEHGKNSRYYDVNPSVLARAIERALKYLAKKVNSSVIAYKSSVHEKPHLVYTAMVHSQNDDNLMDIIVIAVFTRDNGTAVMLSGRYIGDWDGFISKTRSCLSDEKNIVPRFNKVS